MFVTSSVIPTVKFVLLFACFKLSITAFTHAGENSFPPRPYLPDITVMFLLLFFIALVTSKNRGLFAPHSLTRSKTQIFSVDLGRTFMK